MDLLSLAVFIFFIWLLLWALFEKIGYYAVKVTYLKACAEVLRVDEVPGGQTRYSELRSAYKEEC